jgi:hypothetical protein
VFKYQKEICGAIEDRDDLTYSKVGELIGISKQGMSKFKIDGIIGFQKLLRLSYLLFPDEQAEAMARWCLELNATESIQNSFEYAAITRNTSLLDNLLIKHHDATGTLKEYVSVYSIIYRYMQYEIEGYEIIENLNKIDYIGDSALRILVNILKCYDYFAQKKINVMLDFISEIEEMIKNLSDSRKLFSKECYLHRLAELLAPIYLHSNELELSRFYSSLIINANICAKTVSDGSYYMGMTYLNEDSEKCLEYLRKSHDIAKIVGIKELINQTRDNLDYVKIHLGIPLEEGSDSRLILYQNNRLNRSIIDNYIKEKGERDFPLLYRAYSYGSDKELYKCFQKFFSNSNYLFSNLVVKELYDRGDRSVMTKMLMDFKSNNTKGVGSFEEDFIRSFREFDNGIRIGGA